ncbi:MAG: hypothetical protein WKF58_05275 [Ilumatobacteraceae bacterium]
MRGRGRQGMERSDKTENLDPGGERSGDSQESRLSGVPLTGFGAAAHRP